MFKGETESRSAFVSAGPSGSAADGQDKQAAGSASRARKPLQGHIGFIGLGHMGTAIAANLVAAGREVIAYVRRAEQMEKLAALGLKPTTDITECMTVNSSSPCCPTMPPFTMWSLGVRASADSMVWLPASCPAQCICR